MDNKLIFNVEVNTGNGLVTINALGDATTKVGTEAVKAGSLVSKSFSNDVIASISHLTNIYGTVSSAISNVIGKVSEFITASNQVKLALAGLGESARVFGQDQQLANKYARELASDGLITLSSSAGTLKMLLASGFDVSESMKLSKAFKDIGSFNNVVGDLNMAMYDVARGIKTGSVELIENIGFTQRLSSVMKQAGIDISAGIDITNNAAQRQALYNAIMSEGNKFQGNAARLALENSGAYAQLGNAYTMLKAKIGDILNIVFVPLARLLTEIVSGVTYLGSAFLSLTEISKKTSTAAGDQITQFYKLKSAYEDLAPKITKTKEEKEFLKSTINKLQELYPDYLGNLRYEEIGYRNISIELDKVEKGLITKVALQMAEKEVQVIAEKLIETQKEENDLLDKKYKLQGKLDNQMKEAGWKNGIKDETEYLNALSYNIGKGYDAKREAFELINQTIREIADNKTEQEILKKSIATTMKSYQELGSNSLLSAKALEDANKKTEYANDEAYLKALLAKKEANETLSKEDEAYFNKHYRTIEEKQIGERVVIAKHYELIKEIKVKAAKDEAEAIEKAKLDAVDKMMKAKAKPELRALTTTAAPMTDAPKLDLFKTKEEYLQHLKEMQEAGEVFSKTEQEIFNRAYEYVEGYTTDAGTAIDGYYRKRVDEAKKADSEMIQNAKAIAQSALSGMESEIDKVLNYKRQRTNEEYALDRKLSESSYKASVKRIDDELKAEKKGSARYEQLQLERQKLDADYAKSKSDLDKQQELDNLSGMEKAQAVLKAGMKAGIQAVAALTAAEAFKAVWAATGFPVGLFLAPITAAAAYTAVSAFGGMFETGGRVPGGALAGASHKQGGIWVNAEGGEYIFSKKAVSKIGLPVLNQLNFGDTFPTIRPKLPAYEDGGVIRYGFGGGGMSDAKMDKMIALLETNNEINYNRKMISNITIQQRNIDPKIVAKTANKGNEQLTLRRRIG